MSEILVWSSWFLTVALMICCRRDGSVLPTRYDMRHVFHDYYFLRIVGFDLPALEWFQFHQRSFQCDYIALDGISFGLGDLWLGCDLRSWDLRWIWRCYPVRKSVERRKKVRHILVDNDIKDNMHLLWSWVRSILCCHRLIQGCTSFESVSRQFQPVRWCAVLWAIPDSHLVLVVWSDRWKCWVRHRFLLEVGIVGIGWGGVLLLALLKKKKKNTESVSSCLCVGGISRKA
jgi:hypothetical protein